MNKPIKHAVSIVIREDGKVLFALRSENKSSYPNTWSLPSAFVKDDETSAVTIRRIGREKLSVILEPGSLLNEGKKDRGEYVLFMHNYEAKILEGTPIPNSEDYKQLKWEEPRGFLSKLNTEDMGMCTTLLQEYLSKRS